MKKEKSLAEIFDDLEKAAKEIEKKEIFTGANKSLANILAAGLQQLVDRE